MRHTRITALFFSAIFVKLLIFITIVVGYVMNIIDIVNMPVDPLTTELIIRAIGLLVFPLGAFMGIFF